MPRGNNIGVNAGVRTGSSGGATLPDPQHLAIDFISGNTALYPPSLGDGLGWTLTQDYEDGTIGEKYPNFHTTHSLVTDEESYSGNKALKHIITEGSLGDYFGGIVDLPANVVKGDEIWLRVRMFFPIGFDYTVESLLRLKFLRYLTHEEDYTNSGHLDVYLRDKTLLAPFYSVYEGRLDIPSVNFGDNSHDITLGVWETYEWYIKLDDKSIDEGGTAAIRFWKNGQPIFDSSATDTDKVTLKYDHCFIEDFNLFTQWNNTSPATQHCYSDDLVITTVTPANTDSNGFPFIGSKAEGLIFADDFTSGLQINVPQENGFQWRAQNNVAIVATDPFPGETHSAQFKFKSHTDETNGAAPDAFAELRFWLEHWYPDLWIKYEIFIPLNYFHSNAKVDNNNKGPFHFWSTPTALDGDNGVGYSSPIDAAKMWNQFFASPVGDGLSKLKIKTTAKINGEYNHSRQYEEGEGHEEGVISRIIQSGDLGKWMTIKSHIKQASKAGWEAADAAGKYEGGYGPLYGYFELGETIYGDGVYEMWLTRDSGGTPVTTKEIDIQNGDWYATREGSTDDAVGWNYGYLLGWANSGFEEETLLKIAKISFSTTEEGLV